MFPTFNEHERRQLYRQISNNIEEQAYKDREYAIGFIKEHLGKYKTVFAINMVHHAEENNWKQIRKIVKDLHEDNPSFLLKYIPWPVVKKILL